MRNRRSRKNRRCALIFHPECNQIQIPGSELRERPGLSRGRHITEIVPSLGAQLKLELDHLQMRRLCYLWIIESRPIRPGRLLRDPHIAATGGGNPWLLSGQREEAWPELCRQYQLRWASG